MFQVNYLVVSHGGVNIGDVVRSVLKETMSDQLMTKYNRTGRDLKRPLPPAFLKSILSECNPNFVLGYIFLQYLLYNNATQKIMLQCVLYAIYLLGKKPNTHTNFLHFRNGAAISKDKRYSGEQGTT